MDMMGYVIQSLDAGVTLKSHLTVAVILCNASQHTNMSASTALKDALIGILVVVVLKCQNRR